jgi:hypothetical protein
LTQAAASASVNLDGDFYPNFIVGKDYSAAALQAIHETVRKLLEQPTTVNRPGIVIFIRKDDAGKVIPCLLAGVVFSEKYKDGYLCQRRS